MVKRELLVRQNTWQESALCTSGYAPKSTFFFFNVTTNTEDGKGVTKGRVMNSKICNLFCQPGRRKVNRRKLVPTTRGKLLSNELNFEEKNFKHWVNIIQSEKV